MQTNTAYVKLRSLKLHKKGNIMPEEPLENTQTTEPSSMPNEPTVTQPAVSATQAMPSTSPESQMPQTPVMEPVLNPSKPVDVPTETIGNMNEAEMQTTEAPVETKAQPIVENKPKKGKFLVIAVLGIVLVVALGILVFTLLQ